MQDQRYSYAANKFATISGLLTMLGLILLSFEAWYQLYFGEAFLAFTIKEMHREKAFISFVILALLSAKVVFLSSLRIIFADFFDLSIFRNKLYIASKSVELYLESLNNVVINSDRTAHIYYLDNLKKRQRLFLDSISFNEDAIHIIVDIKKRTQAPFQIDYSKVKDKLSAEIIAEIDDLNSRYNFETTDLKDQTAE